MKQVLVAFLFLLLVTGGFAVTPWANSSLQMRQKFVCNLNVNESQYDFPATLTFNSQNLFTKGYMRTDAKDFQFYNDSNSGLQYELLNSTNNSGATIAYVKGNYTTGIDNVVWQYMNGTAQNPFYNQTWSNHYCAVYHLETGNNSAGWTPSTALTIAFGGAVAPTYIPGKQGNALSVLQGATNYLHTPSADAYSSCQIDPQYNYSISFWFNKSSSATASIFFSLEEQAFLGYIGAPCGANSLRISPDGSNYACYSPFSQSPAYTHVLLSRNTTPSNLSLYLNGTYATSETTPVGPLSRVTAVGGGAVAALGMSGTIDEVRMRNVTDVIYSQAEYNHSCIATGLLELNGAGAINYCNATFSFPLINVSIYDDTNLSFLPANTEITLSLYNGTELYNFSANITNRQNFSLCSISNVSGWHISSNESYTNNGTFAYGPNKYYILNDEIQNYGGNNYTRYLGINGVATRFTVLAGAATPIQGAFVQLYRYYPNTGQILMVGMGQTDNNGNTIIYTTPNTVVYRQVIVYNNQIIYTTDLSTIPCDPSATLCEKTVLTTEGVDNEYNAFIGATLVGCGVDNTTRTVFCTSNNPSGTGTNLDLKLYEIGTFQNVLVCQNSLASGSGTVICSIPTANHTYYYVGTVTIGGDNVIGTGYVPDTTPSLNYQTYGMVATAGMIIAFAGFGLVTGGGAAAVLLSFIGLVLAALLQFVVFDWFALMGIGIIAVVIAYIVRN